MSRHVLPITKTSLLCISLAVLLFVFSPQVALAASWSESINSLLWAFISSVFGFLVWLTGAALDFSISYFIVQFGEQFRTSGLGAAVNNLWMVVRDIFNLLFIFGLIYAGFNMIINSDEGGARKAIVNLIIAALLINFSLFITKTIIDFGNIAAVQVAKVLYESAPVDANGDRSISGAFLYNMGAATIWSAQGRAAFQERPPDLIYIFGAMLLFIIASFAFMVGAVLIGIRFIMLNYYMVISPVMFLSRIVPKFSSHTSDFWNSLLKNVFFAPAFLLLLYFSLYILGSMSQFMNIGGQGGRSLFQAFSQPGTPQSNIATIMMFLMAAGFLIASVVLGQKMSMVGSSMAVSIGTDLRKRGQRMLGGATFGLAARIGQRTIGRKAQKMADSDWLKDKAATTTWGAMAFKASKALGDKSFDARHYLKKADLGSGMKGGYASRLKEQAKADKEFAESLDEQKLGDINTVEGRKKREDQMIKIKAKAAEIMADTENGAGYHYSQAVAGVEKIRQTMSDLQGQKSAEEREISEEIDRLKRGAASASDPETRQHFEDQISSKRKEIGALEGRYKGLIEEQTKLLKKQEDKVSSTKKDIDNEAEAAFTYARQLKLMDRRKNQRDRWARFGRPVLGTMAGAGAGAGVGALGTGGALAVGVGAGVGAGLGLASGATARAYSDNYGARASELEKIYGRNGSKKVKDKKKKDQMKDLGNVLKEEGVIPEEKKNDEKDD